MLEILKHKCGLGLFFNFRTIYKTQGQNKTYLWLLVEVKSNLKKFIILYILYIYILDLYHQKYVDAKISRTLFCFFLYIYIFHNFSSQNKDVSNY